MELRWYPVPVVGGKPEEPVQGQLADLKEQPVARDAGRAGERHHRGRASARRGEEEAARFLPLPAVTADLLGDEWAGARWHGEWRGHAARPA
jgi:hypothetical protein